LQHRRQRHPAVGRRARAAFELRQGQQVAHQHLHAVGLLLHQREHAAALGLGQRQAGHGLHKAGQHGERRADLVRHIGHEIPPHGLGAQPLGDILGDQQLLAVTISPHHQLQAALATGRSEVHRLVPGAVLQVADEGRHAYQVGDGLQPVAAGIQPQVVCGHRAAPDDVVGLVEQHHAVGRGLDGGEEFIQLLALCRQRLVTNPHRPLDAVSQLAPQAGIARCVGLQVAAQPGHQSGCPYHVQQQQPAQADQAPHQRAAFGQSQRGAGQKAQPTPQRQCQQRSQQAWQQPGHGSGGLQTGHQGCNNGTCWVNR